MSERESPATIKSQIHLMDAQQLNDINAWRKGVVESTWSTSSRSLQSLSYSQSGLGQCSSTDSNAVVPNNVISGVCSRRRPRDLEADKNHTPGVSNRHLEYTPWSFEAMYDHPRSLWSIITPVPTILGKTIFSVLNFMVTVRYKQYSRLLS
jgi:hypothetical protein